MVITGTHQNHIQTVQIRAKVNIRNQVACELVDKERILQHCKKEMAGTRTFCRKIRCRRKSSMEG